MVRFLVIAASVSTVSARHRESRECRIRDIEEMKDKYKQFIGVPMTKKKCKDRVTASGIYKYWAFQRMSNDKKTKWGKCYGFNSENYFMNTTSNCGLSKTRHTTQGLIPCKGRKGWKDSAGFGCDQYTCTDKYSQASLDAWANGGCSASQVCPECVVGRNWCVNPQDQKLNDVWRVDVDDIVMDCRSFELNKYCGKEGGYGAGWQTKKWGKITDHTDRQGRSAFDACCACAAGSGVASTTLQPETATPQTQGKIAKEIKLSNEECKVRKGWKDSKGDGCEAYSYCSEYNQADLDAWANGGCSASQVCPECVVGISMCENPNDQKLNDAWREDFDDIVIDCRSYEFNKYCNTDGSYGAGWKTKKWGTFSDHTDRKGRSALDACCACGAGSVNKSTRLLLKD